MKYIFKLINGDKIATDKKNFNDWLYSAGDDFIIAFGDSGIPVYIKKEKILLGFKIDVKEK